MGSDVGDAAGVLERGVGLGVEVQTVGGREWFRGRYEMECRYITSTAENPCLLRPADLCLACRILR